MVQGVFLHTLYQGLSEKYTKIRDDLKKCTSDCSVTDDLILEQITHLASEEADRHKRLGHSARHKPVNVNSAQQQGDSEYYDQSFPPTQVDGEVKANFTAIQELTATVSVLAKNPMKKMKSAAGEDQGYTHPPPSGGEAQGYAHNLSSRALTREAPGYSSPLPSTATMTDMAHTKGTFKDCVQQGIESCPH